MVLGFIGDVVKGVLGINDYSEAYKIQQEAIAAAGQAEQGAIQSAAELMARAQAEAAGHIARGQEAAARATIEAAKIASQAALQAARVAVAAQREFFNKANVALQPTIKQGRFAADEMASMLAIPNAQGDLVPWDISKLTELPEFDTAMEAIDRQAVGKKLSSEQAERSALAGTNLFQNRLGNLGFLAGGGMDAERSLASAAGQTGGQIGLTQSQLGNQLTNIANTQGTNLANIAIQGGDALARNAMTGGTNLANLTAALGESQARNALAFGQASAGLSAAPSVGQQLGGGLMDLAGLYLYGKAANVF
jgi:hypothetical protein